MIPSLKKILHSPKKYGVTSYSCSCHCDENGELLETYIGGLPITQNIRKLWTKYDA